MSLFLSKERNILESFFPDFDSIMTSNSFLDREENTEELIRKFRDLNGTTLLIPKQYGGLGANMMEALYIHRAIASRSASLAIAYTMHHFSVASLVSIVAVQPELKRILKKLVENKWILSSSFAEGNTNTIFSPAVTAKDEGDHFLINGVKKPCTLSKSMDLLTGSVKLPDGQVAIFTAPRNSKGIEVKPFWKHWILKGSETEEIVLHNVKVPKENVFIAGTEDNLHPTVINGLIWFELLVSTAYIGICSSLIEKVIYHTDGIPKQEIRKLISLTEGAMHMVEGVAYKFENNQFLDYVLPEVLFVRKNVEEAIRRAANAAVSLLGGINFLQNTEISYQLLVCQLLQFHPPTKIETFHIMDSYIGSVAERV
ncbi:acyl-CoA dehydrogenase family protein [Bacillus thuringiensis]|uniref:acyl-CoA dehydrogenase family protein n=1 Tax=Bacillus thuringiensis TaxID=1428 RepID=UPI000E503E59|nr:acyl-CoA dehydrogenase family protein [Bacillus thuringiensis]MDZ3956914.1 acyl-CoA dehydrogenase family protein [Bacillus thuringiensis]RGP42345.1 hypothetical protein BTW32_31260 [Bacillus thuringiensis]